MTAQLPIKVYVAVDARLAEDGTLLPREITWEDGTKFEIDRVLDIRQAAALKAGGQGDRYTVRIGLKANRVTSSSSEAPT